MRRRIKTGFVLVFNQNPVQKRARASFSVCSGHQNIRIFFLRVSKRRQSDFHVLQTQFDAMRCQRRQVLQRFLVIHPDPLPIFFPNSKHDNSFPSLIVVFSSALARIFPITVKCILEKNNSKYCSASRFLFSVCPPHVKITAFFSKHRRLNSSSPQYTSNRSMKFLSRPE